MMAKTYKDSEILISMQCQGPYSWTAAIEEGEFKNNGIFTQVQSRTPADALRELAKAFELQAQHNFFYKRIK